MALIRIFFGIAVLAGFASAQSAGSLSINRDNSRLASQPAFARHPGGQTTFVWNSYRLHREKVLSVTESGGRLSKRLQLSPGEGIYYEPLMVATSEDSGWVFWSRLAAGKWELVGRRMESGRWRARISLADNALALAALVHEGKVLLTWEDHGSTPERIRQRVWDAGEWSEPEWISPAGAAAYRPAMTAIDGEVWTLWDSYQEGEYSVWGQSAGSTLHDLGSDPVRISPPQRDSLKVAANGGVAVWVSTVDVRGGADAIDHWDTLEASLYRDGAWTKAEKVADLRHGLLPRLEPEPDSMWGYAGRRRNPMLATDGDDTWLLWERKTIHDGRSFTTGELCGRRFDGEEWHPRVRLHHGLVDYRLGANPVARNGKLLVVAKDIHHYFLPFELDLGRGEPIADEEWTAWRKERLDLGRKGARPSIEVDGKRYNLYWGDLHVHSDLSPDAEGEVDELMHYARDRAGMDVVVIQENDSNSWMKSNPQGAYLNHFLTESEYELSVYFSRRYTEPGRFVALPGWEWSQRTDDNKSNHRTVIYAGKDTPLIRHPENGNDFDELCDVVESAGGLMNTQHGAYRLVDRPCDANIEVAAGWGVYINDPVKIHADLSRGYKVGFVATSDGHRRNPGTGGGLTAMYATELTPESILEALREHRVYATNGSRAFLDARANGVLMGQDLEAAGAVRLSLAADAERPILRAELIRDGERIHVANGGAPELKAKYEDRPGAGFHWYYWRIVLEGPDGAYPANLKSALGNLAWTSPHRVTVK